MKNIREIIRLYDKLKLTGRKISRAVNVSRPVVSDYIIAFKKSGLKYEDIQNISDENLSEILLTKKKESARYSKLSSEFEYYAQELKKKHVTLQKLWEEYSVENPGGYSHSQFSHHYSVWRSASEITMHIEHKAGDKMFIDFTGKKLWITDKETGQKREVETFVAILGASQLTYVEATETQKTRDWIKGTESSMWYFGGVPKAIVPDCYKSAVTKPDKYEPVTNPTFCDFAKHYETTILPTRPYSPKDKALVEGAVKIVYAWIYAELRNCIFYSVNDLNQAILVQLEKYNLKKMQKIKKSRKELFDEIEKSELGRLPLSLYEFKSFSRNRVWFNYHIYLLADKHYYSVPYKYIGKKTDVIYSERNVEIYYENVRIAFHGRNRNPNGYTTLKEHMSSAHKWVSEWSAERISGWATKIGENVRAVVEKIMSGKEHPEQGFKVSLGIINLGKKHTDERLDKACKKAIYFDCYSLKWIKNTLENNLEDFIPETELFTTTLPEHENIRGNEYYN